jgi:hypothetical protein
MTQRQVFEQLQFEMFMRYAMRHMHPNTKVDTFVAERYAIVYAVQNTWYYFNNQEEFKKKCIYSLPSKA